ncbi:V-type ATP synthase subunit I [Aerococcaceae bacterium DSM 111020]|nr:V-type ATP synthase subunit I [Aerococcaceae bacterium DSM 111020]
MAISPMKRISLLAAEDLVDDVLTIMQGLQEVEIIDLHDAAQWDSVDDKTESLIDEYAKDHELTSSDIIEDYETRTHRIERAIEQIQKFVPQAPFLQRMRAGKREVTYRQIETHGRQFDEEQVVNDTLNKIKRLRILEDDIEVYREEIDKLYKWRKLEVTPKRLRSFKYVTGVIGRVPTTNEDEIIKHLKEDEDLKYETVFVDENDYGVVVLSYNKNRSEILEELKQYQFIPFNYYDELLPSEKIKQYEILTESSKEERQKLIQELKSNKAVLEDLQLQYEYVNNLTAREKAKYAFARSKHLIAIQGWIEANNVDHFLGILNRYIDEEVLVKVEDPQEIDYGHVPTKLRNNKLVAPFEMITNMYGVPNYDEIDPTPLVMPFYALFFGMMLADLGYGLILLLGSAIPLLLFNLTKSQKQTLSLVLTLAVSTIVWGVIYGSFFGFTIEWMQIVNLQESVMEVMIFSMGLGLIHMGIAFGLNTYLKFKNKEYATGFAEGLHWILVIVSVVLMIIGSVYSPLSILFNVGIGLVILSFIGMFVSYVVDAGSIAGIGPGLLGLINGVSYFGDVISYSRLMALGLSGVSIGAAFNLIIAQFPPVARFTIGLLLFAGLHLFNMFLSVLTGGVHSLRLIFVEFFGKFYTGQGREFDPLEVEEKYVTIKNKKMED